ncbi:MAG: branched-chain amino acid ABC transporter permease [Candidatus Methanomethylicota archaeon]|uniref:Branched-chain amino acid ABC transporter permease n=1 Tax=Thermoproteota archaeon TaxID=2056631 RepID=A0A497EW11_9CREN|nr:MAG: branched-chain amino acid ABC transporter permease [Candidatus Verstraetearchaeota archaeon]
MIAWETLAQVLINGLITGGIYGLIALGLSIIFGVMRVINIAHGDFMMLGAYTSYWLFVYSGGLINPFISLIISVPLGFIVGVAIYWILVNRVVEAPELMSLLLMFGVSTFIANMALWAWTAYYRGIPYTLPSISIGSIVIPLCRLLAFILAIAITFGLYVLFTKTYIGKAVRAVSQNRLAASLMGIDVVKIFAFSFGLGAAIAFAAGSLITMSVERAFDPYIGGHYTLLSFCIAVLGGLGSMRGALIGGLIIGLIESFTGGLFIPVSLVPAIYFAIMYLVLLFKPTGLMGR